MKYDVIVAGGGVTGCCAALAAARSGIHVLLIEKNAFLGGNMTGGLPWLGFHEKSSGNPVVGGIPLEFIKVLQKQGAATEFVFDPITGSAVGVNPAMLKLVLFDILKQAGVDFLMHSLVTHAEENKITVHNKEGSRTYDGKIIIDCTDSADVCVLAGGEYTYGRKNDGKTQVASCIARFTDIDYPEMLAYFKENPTQIRPFTLEKHVCEKLLKQMETAPLAILGAFSNIIKGARRDGLEYKRDQLIGVVYPPLKELMLVASRVEGVNVNDAQNHTGSEIEGVLQTKVILELLHNYIPGCHNVRLLAFGPQIGVRETRHIHCDHMLSADDLLKPALFHDSIAKGNYHLDIHSPDHGGLETRQPPVYQIPYRSLLPKGLECMLVAGRCIGADHEAMSSTRVAPIVGALGEAAGTAASIAVKKNVPLREIDINELQNTLRVRGAIF